MLKKGCRVRDRRHANGTSGKRRSALRLKDQTMKPGSCGQPNQCDSSPCHFWSAVILLFILWVSARRSDQAIRHLEGMYCPHFRCIRDQLNRYARRKPKTTVIWSTVMKIRPGLLVHTEHVLYRDMCNMRMRCYQPEHLFREHIIGNFTWKYESSCNKYRSRPHTSHTINCTTNQQCVFNYKIIKKKKTFTFCNMQIAATFRLSANITNCTVTSFLHSTKFYFIYRHTLKHHNCYHSLIDLM